MGVSWASVVISSLPILGMGRLQWAQYRRPLRIKAERLWPERFVLDGPQSQRVWNIWTFLTFIWPPYMLLKYPILEGADVALGLDDVVRDRAVGRIEFLLAAVGVHDSGRIVGPFAQWECG